MLFPSQRNGSFSEDRPLGWDPVAAGNRAGDGMARFVSEEKATGLLSPHKLFANACAVQKAICRL